MYSIIIVPMFLHGHLQNMFPIDNTANFIIWYEMVLTWLLYSFNCDYFSIKIGKKDLQFNDAMWRHKPDLIERQAYKCSLQDSHCKITSVKLQLDLLTLKSFYLT